MTLDKNLPQEGCFVGLVQRLHVFCSNSIGFTLNLTCRELKPEICPEQP